MPQFAQNGFIRQEVILPVVLALTTDAEVRLSKALGYRAELIAASFFTTVAGTGAGATRALTIGKNGDLDLLASEAIVLAATDVLGEETEITLTDGDARLFEDADTLEIGFASGGTVFTAGAGFLRLVFLQRPQVRS